jgi:hypothetical protein
MSIKLLEIISIYLKYENRIFGRDLNEDPNQKSSNFVCVKIIRFKPVFDFY